MPLSSTYTTGTITVAANGTAVTGTGANWLAGGIRPGDILAVRGLTVTIAAVTNANTLFLATTWPGSALSGARYEIRYTPDATRVLASSREAIAAIESARSDIYISANVYPSPAAGLAATTPGQQFQTISVNGENVVRYRHDAGGVATEIARFPTATMVNAAVTAASTAATTAANDVRGEVKADADRAAAALTDVQALVTTVSLATVRQQDDGTWPPRPNAPVVHFLGWDDPRTLMRDDDLWFSPETYPTVPAQISADDWEFHNARDGQRAVIRVLRAPPAQRPAILRYDYRIDGGSPIPIPATAGEIFVQGLTSGQAYSAEIRAVNYLGPGMWSGTRGVLVTAQPFTDNFNRGNQNLSGGNWTVISTSTDGRMEIVSQQATHKGVARTEGALFTGYMPPDQYVRAQIASSAPRSGGSRHGASLLFRAAKVGAFGMRGYVFRVGSTSWSLARETDLVANPVEIATGAIPAGLTAPFLADARVIGSAITLSLGGTVVWTGTDATFNGGTAGMYGTRKGTDPQNIWDDFEAGAAV